MLDLVIVGLVLAIIALNALRRIRARYRRDALVQSRILRSLHRHASTPSGHLFRGHAAVGAPFQAPAE